MSEKTKLKEIMELLANNEMSSVEIAPKVNITVSFCSSYLNTLMNDGRIIRTTDKRPFKYKLATPLKELLKQLYSIMDNMMDYIKKPSDSEKQIILEIEELIK